MMDFSKDEVAGFCERAVKTAQTDSGRKMADVFIQPWQMANRSSEEQIRIRQETMAAILAGKEHFNRIRTMMAAWTKEGDLVFPDGVIAWVNDFVQKNRTDKYESGQWMTLSTVFAGVGDPATVRGEDMVLLEKRNFSESPMRAGWIHTHGDVDYLFSDTDIRRTIFDPQVNFAFLGLTNGDRWLMVRNISPVDFARRNQENGKETDDVLKRMGDEQMEIHRENGGVDKHNEVTMKYLQQVCQLVGVEIYKIPAGSNSGTKICG